MGNNHTIRTSKAEHSSSLERKWWLVSLLCVQPAPVLLGQRVGLDEQVKEVFLAGGLRLDPCEREREKEGEREPAKQLSLDRFKFGVPRTEQMPKYIHVPYLLC